MMIECSRLASASKKCHSRTRQQISSQIYSVPIIIGSWRIFRHLSSQNEEHFSKYHNRFDDALCHLSRVFCGVHRILGPSILQIRRDFSTSSKDCSNESITELVSPIDKLRIHESQYTSVSTNVTIISDQVDLLTLLENARVPVQQMSLEVNLHEIGANLADTMKTLCSPRNIKLVKTLIQEDQIALQNLLSDIFSLFESNKFSCRKSLVSICKAIHALEIQPSIFDSSWGNLFLLQYMSSFELSLAKSSVDGFVIPLSTILNLIKLPPYDSIYNPDDIAPSFLATYLSIDLSLITAEQNSEVVPDLIDLLESFARLQLQPDNILPGSMELILTSLQAKNNGHNALTPVQMLAFFESLSALNINFDQIDLNNFLQSMFTRCQKQIANGELSTHQMRSLLVAISTLPDCSTSKMQLLEAFCQFTAQSLLSSSGEPVNSQELAFNLYALSLNISLSNINSEDNHSMKQEPVWLISCIEQHLSATDSLFFSTLKAEELGLMFDALGKLKFQPSETWLLGFLSYHQAKITAKTVDCEDLTTLVIGLHHLSVDPYQRTFQDFFQPFSAACVTLMRQNAFSTYQLNVILTFFQPAKAMSLPFLRAIISNHQFHLKSKDLSIDKLIEIMRVISSRNINPEISNPGFLDAYIEAFDVTFKNAVKSGQSFETEAIFECFLFAVSQLESPAVYALRILLTTSIRYMRAGLCSPFQLHLIISQLARIESWSQREIRPWSEAFLPASLPLLSVFNEEEFSGTLAAFKVLGTFPDDDWLNHFFAASRQMMLDGRLTKTASYVSILRTLGRKRIHPDLFLNETSTTTTTWIETFLLQSQKTIAFASATDLYLLIDSMVALNIYPAAYNQNNQESGGSCQWVAEYMDRSKALLALHKFNCRELQNSIPALLALKIKPDVEWKELFIDNCLKRLERKDFTPGGLLWTLHAIEKLRVPFRLIHPTFRTVVLENCNRFIASGVWDRPNQGVDKVMSILAKLNIRPCEEVFTKYKAMMSVDVANKISARESR